MSFPPLRGRRRCPVGIGTALPTLGRLLSLTLLATLVGCGDSHTPTRQPAVTLANLNLVHGIFCAPDTEACRLEDRVDLMMEFVVASGCPDFVTVQEVWPPSLDLIRRRAPSACSFPYELVQGESRTGVDDELLLSRYPASRIGQFSLFGDFRRVLWTRIDHPEGPIDIFSTHLASGADGGPNPCGEACPAACVAAGAKTVRDCQAVQLVEYAEATRDPSRPALVAGDMNARPDSFAYARFMQAGWIDTYLAAGNPECDPESGIGCTSGRKSETLEDLEAPDLGLRSRIDYIFLVPGHPQASCNAQLLPASGLGPGTQLWADRPNPFASICGEAPASICWSSDHTGVQVAFVCTPGLPPSSP